jgi:hypothetical protein
MNRFRKLGFIKYDAGENTHVHSSLLNIVLCDDSEQIANRDLADSSGRQAQEPPARPGGLPDRDRAQRPPLRNPGTRVTTV